MSLQTALTARSEEIRLYWQDTSTQVVKHQSPALPNFSLLLVIIIFHFFSICYFPLSSSVSFSFLHFFPFVLGMFTAREWSADFITNSFLLFRFVLFTNEAARMRFVFRNPMYWRRFSCHRVVYTKDIWFQEVLVRIGFCCSFYFRGCTVQTRVYRASMRPMLLPDQYGSLARIRVTIKTKRRRKYCK